MTLVMLTLLMVPEPLRTVQVCDGLEGWVLTVTEKAALLASRSPKTKLPLALKLKSSLSLIWSTSPDPLIPVTVPPTVYLVPPEMGHPDRANPRALTITRACVFTNALRKILQPRL